MPTNPRPDQHPYSQLSEHWQLIVKLHTNGHVYASVGRMDLTTRKVRWIALQPREWWGDPHAAAVSAVFEASTELALAQGEQLRLF